MADTTTNPPLCPVTGERAVRLVQSIKSRFLIDLWRYALKVDARASLAPHPRINLWESPVGLYFFDPLVEGDHQFYTTMYGNVPFANAWWYDHNRPEFLMAARNVKPGDKVLDVGCGAAGFRKCIPGASYLGLDPNFAEGSGIENVRNQTLAEHLVDHAGSYDVACSFQVIEHVKNPATVYADMVRAVRPGGLVIIGVPHVPCAATRIPNWLVNAPPHHLTWWTKPALAALAERNGTSVVSIEQVPWGPHDSVVYWIERCSPIRCKDIHYCNRMSWHLSAIFGFYAGRLMHALRRLPETKDEGISLLLVARRPG
jgi:SAM-dependent methyltransferase